MSKNKQLHRHEDVTADFKPIRRMVTRNEHGEEIAGFLLDIGSWRFDRGVTLEGNGTEKFPLTVKFSENFKPGPDHVVVMVSGGVVTAVHGTNYKTKIVVVDFDNEEGDMISTYNGDAFDSPLTPDLVDARINEALPHEKDEKKAWMKIKTILFLVKRTKTA